MKYIIEFMGGSKGDLLVRFLNGLDANFIAGNRTAPVSENFINWLKLLDPNILTLERFEEVLASNTKKYISAHPLWVTLDKNYIDVLNKYQYNIIKVKLEPKHYVTVRIESILKNIREDKQPTIIDILNTLYFKQKELTNFLYKDIAGNKNSPITEQVAWEDRSDVAELFNNRLIDNRKTVDYDELYIDFTSELLNGYDLDKWKQLVEKSWGDYQGNGYREYKSLGTIPSTRLGNTINTYLESINATN